MALTGRQKAALLLTTLDSSTATQLLKDIEPDVVQELAVELASMDASGLHKSGEELKITKEFYKSLKTGQGGGFNIKGFLNEMLVSILGQEKAEEVQNQIKLAAHKRDPFSEIRLASTDELVLALDGQHQQTVALVLSELAPDKSQKVLSRLSEEIRLKAICKMTKLDSLGPEVRRRIASMVFERINAFKGETLPEERDQTLRKLAIVLSGLETDLRNRLIEEIGKQDEETSNKVRNLMVTWEDVASIADRSLQEILRNVDSGKLAVAIFGADEEIVQKIRSNISERAAESLDEEASLMQEPLEKEIKEAREIIVKPLREASEAGTLRFAKRH